MLIFDGSRVGKRIADLIFNCGVNTRNDNVQWSCMLKERQTDTDTERGGKREREGGKRKRGRESE